MVLVAAFPARAQVPDPPKTPVAEGTGGSAATVDPLATQAAIDTLRSGGNAVDAAVAAAGVLGVVEPFSCGIGGGGFMVVYDAAPSQGRHDRLARDGAGRHDADDVASSPSDGTALAFTEARVGGLSVGVPGTVARLGDRAEPLRHALGSPRCCGPASGSRARASASTRPSTGRSTTTTRPLRRLPRHPRTST